MEEEKHKTDEQIMEEDKHKTTEQIKMEEDKHKTDEQIMEEDKHKTTEQIKDECKNFNYNGMNQYEVINDMSKVIGIDLFNERKFIWRRYSLLGGIPKHSNLYNIITKYNSIIPNWFYQKYTDIEENLWEYSIPKSCVEP